QRCLAWQAATAWGLCSGKAVEACKKFCSLSALTEALPSLPGYKTITVRKFMQVIGSGVSSMFALCLGQTSSFCNAIVFASASVGLQTFNHSGISVNVQDLAPSCAGLLFGKESSGLCVVCVYLAGYLMETTGSWISVFNLVAAVNSVGLCAFLVFGEAQRVDTDSAYIDM
uniref:Uncharacterized protein n=1 Tax=Meleagris gallopavo TaxID=9103 RepID=A0A803XT23_MELGA